MSINNIVFALPLVSIIIPTHNRSEMVSRAINSVLYQTYTNIEIIVINDGSSDNTQEVLHTYNDHRIKILTNEIPKGACYARNKGIFAATGEFVTFLDDDDEFLSTRIEKMISAWDDKLAYIATGIWYITHKKREKRIPPNIITLQDILFEIRIGNSVLTKKERLTRLNGFDETLSSSQDYDMWVRLNQEFGNSFCIQEPLLIMHTEHEKPRITTSKKKIQGHFNFYQKHKNIMSSEQREAKIFELYRYKNKKIGILKAIRFGRSKSLLDILKYIIKSRLFRS